MPCFALLFVIGILSCFFSNPLMAQLQSTGADPSDCSNCGGWPWNFDCRWPNGVAVQQGFYREYAGTRGSANCHQEGEALPFSESLSFTMSQTNTYGLKAEAKWSWFGLTASASTALTASDSVTPTNTCNAQGCCLEPMKAYVRWDYDQRVSKRQIAMTYYYPPGTSVPIYGGYTTCTECNENTRKLGHLIKFPGPELLSAATAAATEMAYDPSLQTIEGLCGYSEH